MRSPVPTRTDLRRALVFAVMALLVAACSASTPQATPAPAPAGLTPTRENGDVALPTLPTTGSTDRPSSQPESTSPFAASPIDPWFFGVEAMPFTDDPSVLDPVFDAAAALGVTHVGVNRVLWADLQPEPPVAGAASYDWSTLDAMADRARQHGVRLQLTMQVISPWGTETAGKSTGPSSESAPVLTEHLDAYDTFVGDLVGRYADVVSILMVGNEAEVPSHWGLNGSAAHPATAATYLDLLERTRGVVADIAPEMIVARASTNFGPVFDDLPAGDIAVERLAGIGEEAGAVPGEFLDNIDAAIARQDAYDAFAVHPNHGAEGVWGIAEFLAPRLEPDTMLIAEDMRSTRVLSEFGPVAWTDSNGNGIEDVVEVLDADLPLGGLDPASAEAQYRAAQSDTLVEKVVLAAQGSYDAVFVSSLVDFGPTYPIPTWRYAGLLEPGGQLGDVAARPAYSAYRELIDTLVASTPTGVRLRHDRVIASFDEFDVVWPRNPGQTIEFTGDPTTRVRRFPRLSGETGMIALEAADPYEVSWPVLIDRA